MLFVPHALLVQLANIDWGVVGYQLGAVKIAMLEVFKQVQGRQGATCVQQEDTLQRMECLLAPCVVQAHIQL